jgi:oxygen-independent coproporphyrinogen III oxidase
VLGLIRDTVKFDHLSGPDEFSIESTPESLTESRARILAEFGVTRVSLGVQSFRPESLTALDRRHTATQVPQAVAAARRWVRDLSLDLMFASPGQTLADWHADLATALQYHPEHLSTYGLTYEKGTPLWKQRHRGALLTTTEDDELAMYDAAIDTLHAAGYDHYEISNFARPGHACQHNLRYWANEACFGVGVGAARYINGERSLNTRDTDAYIRKTLAGEDPTFQRECLPPIERAAETLAVQLRRAQGVIFTEFATQTGVEVMAFVGSAVRELVGLGLLELPSPGQVRLTRRGQSVADAVITALFRDAEGLQSAV